LYDQVWNDDFLAVSSNAAPDEDWWTQNIISEHCSSEVYQENHIAFGSVLEISNANEAMGSTSTAFQPASQSSGYIQQLPEFNAPANFVIEFEQTTPQAYPDSADCMVDQNSTSPAQLDWNSLDSSSILGFDCDIDSTNSGVSTPPYNETLYQKSQENPKCQISVLHPFKCPYCPQLFLRERLEYVFYFANESLPFAEKYVGITFRNPTSISNIQTYVMVAGGVLVYPKI
jgi:hypothetical protein